MTKEQALNTLIKGVDTDKISDGYHTFGELYEHRCALFIVLARTIDNWDRSLNAQGANGIWRSKRHSDGSEYDGWFLLGMHKKKGEQISYHIPMKLWHQTDFAETLEAAPEFDGHTSADVLIRIMLL